MDFSSTKTSVLFHRRPSLCALSHTASNSLLILSSLTSPFYSSSPLYLHVFSTFPALTTVLFSCGSPLQVPRLSIRARPLSVRPGFLLSSLLSFSSSSLCPLPFSLSSILLFLITSRHSRSHGRPV